MPDTSRSAILLSYAFRPFFLLAGGYAVILQLAWIFALHGHGLPVNPLWHAHEMIFGFALAAVAGFSLTAVANWTRRPAVHGLELGLLIVTWLAGRLAMWLAAENPLAGAVSLLFPFLLCLLLGREIILGRSRRNYGLIVVLAALLLAGMTYYYSSQHLLPLYARDSLLAGLHLILVLVVVIAGRIIPNFSANWFRRQGMAVNIHNPPWLGKASLLATVLTAVALVFYPHFEYSWLLATITGLLHAARLAGWRGLKTLSNPLLFILHLSYAWIPLAYLLLAIELGGDMPMGMFSMHAFSTGVVANFILAVITRVSLGHTGRELRASRAVVSAYVLLFLAAVVRVFAPAGLLPYIRALDISSGLWILAFVIFIISYWRILTTPRLS